MISPQPDIRSLEIDTSRDDWMILACDGIWNFMTSQEVVDYLNPKIPNTPDDKLSTLCEEVNIITEAVGYILLIGVGRSCLSTAWPRTRWGTAPAVTT